MSRRTVTLTSEFDPSVPDDMHELGLTTHARDLALCIAQLDDDIRALIDRPEPTSHGTESLHYLRKRIRERLEEAGITMPASWMDA